MQRLSQLAAQVAPASASSSSSSSASPSASSTVVSSRENVNLRTKSLEDVLSATKVALKWNGWGFRDTGFVLDPKTGHVGLAGSRYSMSGKAFPNLRPWCEDKLGLDINVSDPPQSEEAALAAVPKAVECPEAFARQLRERGAEWCARVSSEAVDRLSHAHGATAEDVFKLRYSMFERVPDLVLWPVSHDAVVAIVAAASELADQISIIPYGGGTSVCHAVEPPAHERRCIISLDMRCMNRILWVDTKSRLACIEAGVVGKDLEATLEQSFGLCTGHEPDSSELSTLGGWIATRASGMKKNVYGNIEDIVMNTSLVTPTGVMERGALGAPRISAGPDMNNLVIGSEGNLGVITRAVLKLKPVPKVRKYGSIIFRKFEDGVAFMKALADARLAPASVRLVDNAQFQLGALLKPPAESLWSSFTDSAKKVFVTKVLGFDVNTMVAATLSFEGSDPKAVKLHEDAVYAIAKVHGGVAGGEENGIRGYFLTYMIAYIRDFGYDYYLIAESFETSVPWAGVLDVCNNTRARIEKECHARGIVKPYISARVTQTYDTGAAVYFYFGFIYKNLEDPVRAFAEIETAARDEVVANGGCISHHHGVGKLRKPWMKGAVGEVGISALKGLKDTLDPKNLFGAGNLLP